MASMVLAVRDDDAAIIEQVLMVGDLSKLTPSQRVAYYLDTCKSLDLNPRTKPFDYITLNGKLTLYAKKDCAEQLRSKHGVSITRLDKEVSEGVYIVTAYARDMGGREDTDIGAVSIEGLKGEAKSNAMMKAITKSKRRVTLSICGLGFLDETEIDSIPDARPVRVDIETGVIEGETRPVETKSQPPAASVARMTPDEVKTKWGHQDQEAEALGIQGWQFGLPKGEKLAWYIDEVERRGAMITAEYERQRAAA